MTTYKDRDEKDEDDEVVLAKGSLEGDDLAWWAGWRKRLWEETGMVRKGRGNRKRRRMEASENNMDVEMVKVEVMEDKEPLAMYGLDVKDDKDDSFDLEDLEMDEKEPPEEIRILIKVGLFFDVSGRIRN